MDPTESLGHVREEHGTTAARVSRNLYNSNHRRNVSQRKASRDSLLSFFLSFFRFDRGKKSKNPIFETYLPFETLETFRMDLWKSSKNAPRAFYHFILSLLFVTLRRTRITPRKRKSGSRNRGYSNVSRLVLPIVGKRETDKSDRLAAVPIISHCEIVAAPTSRNLRQLSPSVRNGRFI